MKAGGTSEIERSAASGTTMRVSRTEIPQRSNREAIKEKQSAREASPDGNPRKAAFLCNIRKPELSRESESSGF